LIYIGFFEDGHSLCNTRAPGTESITRQGELCNAKHTALICQYEGTKQVLINRGHLYEIRQGNIFQEAMQDRLLVQAFDHRSHPARSAVRSATGQTRAQTVIDHQSFDSLPAVLKRPPDPWRLSSFVGGPHLFPGPGALLHQSNCRRDSIVDVRSHMPTAGSCPSIHHWKGRVLQPIADLWTRSQSALGSDELAPHPISRNRENGTPQRL